MNLNELIDQKISLEGEIADLRKLAMDSSVEFDHSAFSKKKEELAKVVKDIEAAQREEAVSFEYPKPTQPMAPETNKVSNVTEQKDDFNQDAKKGYSCGGELIADAIQFAYFGKTGNEFRDNRFLSYKQSTDLLNVGLDQYDNIVQASGNASTVIDGVEIIPDLQPGINEYGEGLGVREVLSMFQPESTNRKQVDYYVNEDTYNVDGLVTARVSEGGQLSPQNFNNDLESFRLYKVGVFAAITEEDLQNVPLLETRYMNRAPAVIDVQKVQDIIEGDGVAKPIGITDSSNTAAITQTRDTASEIKYVDVVNMLSRLKSGMGREVFMCNQTALPQLWQIQDGRGAYLWKDNTNQGIVNAIMPGTLMGRPVIVSEDVPAVAAAGGLILCNTAGYKFAQHTSGVRFAESMHFYFDTDKRALRWLSQYGGRPVFKGAYTPRKGGLNLSHFVLLGA